MESLTRTAYLLRLQLAQLSGSTAATAVFELEEVSLILRIYGLHSHAAAVTQINAGVYEITCMQVGHTHLRIDAADDH
jgi:hypothetical protein